MDLNPKPSKVRIAEAAKEIGVGISTLRKIIKRREIGVEKLTAKNHYIYRAEIEAFKNRRNQPRLAI